MSDDADLDEAEKWATGAYWSQGLRDLITECRTSRAQLYRYKRLEAAAKEVDVEWESLRPSHDANGDTFLPHSVGLNDFENALDALAAALLALGEP